MKKRIAVTLFVAFGAVIALAKDDKMNVKIVNRQSSQTDYNYVVPARSTTYTNASANTNANANCSGDTVVNCNGSAYTTGSSNSTTTSTPSYAGSYHVTGATFTLLLPDGRRAVVNCTSKFAEHFAGPAGNHRSCRVPLVDDIQAEFHGNDAKLFWSVSLDGKKKESETYKILAVVN